MEIRIKLDVFFEDAFWVGVFERAYDGKYEVSKVIFGPEPKDYEVLDFISKNFYQLRFTNPLNIEVVEKRKINPKRYQREINREMENRGMSTKAQLAMQMQHETNKIEKKIISRDKKEEEKHKKFELRQHKKNDKHRGH